MRKAQIYLTSAVMAFLVLTSLSALAFAPEGSSPEGKDGEIPYPGMWEGRSFSYERDADGAYLSSMMTEENITDSIYLSVSTYDGLQIYYSASSGNWEEGISMDIGFDVLGLVEFVDTNGNGEYDPEIDELVSTLPLSSSFQYLDFIPGDDPVEPPVEPPVDPEPPSDDEWEKGYSEGFDIGYEVGYKVGVEYAENGNMDFPDPWEYFPELEDLFGDLFPGDGWDEDYEDDDWIDDGSYPGDDWDMPYFEIIDNDDGTITLIIINEDGTEENILFESIEEFEEWMLNNMPGIPGDPEYPPEDPEYPPEDPEYPPEDPGYPPEDPEYPPEVPVLDPSYEGYLFGIMDGFFQGYMEGFGMDDIISYPYYEEDIEYMEEEEINMDWDKDIWCPVPWPVWEDHFLPIEANTEKYGSEGYELDYTVSEYGGYVVFDIYASGPLAGENAFKPAIGLEMTIDYPYTQNNTQTAVIMENSFSTLTYTGGMICYLDDGMVLDAPERIDVSEDVSASDESGSSEDMDTPQIPWKVFDADGNELSCSQSTYYRSYSEYEDLYSKSIYSSEGMIISLPASDNDYTAPVEDPEDPPKDDEVLPPEEEKEEEEDDERYQALAQEEDEKDDDFSEKGASNEGVVINLYTAIGVLMVAVIIGLSLIAGYLAYRKYR